MGERHVAVALDFSPSSKYAMTWALENIVRHGDDVLLIVVKKVCDEDGLSNLWQETGSPLIPLNDLKDPSVVRKYQLEDDQTLLGELGAAAKAKQLQVNMKVYYGDARLKIALAVVEHSVDALVMGNRGESKIKRLTLALFLHFTLHARVCPTSGSVQPKGMRNMISLSHSRMLLGSVSNYIVNNVPCPVTVVKLPDQS